MAEVPLPPRLLALRAVLARKVMCMEWPSTSALDAVIVPEETSPGLCFVLCGRPGLQIACRSYAEAETRALSYAEHAGASVWYADAQGIQLVDSFVRVADLLPPVPAPDAPES